MKIKEIIVDKLPKSCEECSLLNLSKQFPHEYCPVINKELNVHGDCEDKRHDKCILKITPTLNVLQSMSLKKKL